MLYSRTLSSLSAAGWAAAAECAVHANVYTLLLLALVTTCTCSLLTLRMMAYLDGRHPPPPPLVPSGVDVIAFVPSEMEVAASA